MGLVQIVADIVELRKRKKHSIAIKKGVLAFNLQRGQKTRKQTKKLFFFAINKHDTSTLSLIDPAV